MAVHASLRVKVTKVEILLQKLLAGRIYTRRHGGQVFRRNDEKRYHTAATTAPTPREGHQGPHHT